MAKSIFKEIRFGSTLFGRFELLQCLDAHHGRAVFLCHEPKRNNRLLALKVSLHEERAKGLPESLSNEAEVARRVRHNNVVRCYGVFHDEATDACGTEYMAGGALSDMMDRFGRMDYRGVFRMLLHLSSGLTAIHKAGIIHRDLKPGNILLDETQTAKITDFGIAVLNSETARNDGDVIVGTMNYLSPEYAAFGRFDHRSDIYSLGLIAFELLTGKLPEQADTPLERLLTRTRAHAPDVREFRPNCPAALAIVINHALAREPSRRLQSAEIFQMRLLEALTAAANDSRTRKSDVRELTGSDTNASVFDA